MSKQVLLRLNIERILFEETSKLRPEIHQPAYVTNAIERLVDLGRLEKQKKRVFPSRLIKQLALQAEAVYVYSMLKCVLMSETEQEAPDYACIATGYKIEKNLINKTPYYGLKSY